MNYKKYHWTVIANDYDSALIRHYCFIKGFMKYNKLLNISNSVIGVVSQKNDIEYVGDLSTWTQSHEDLKKQVEQRIII